MIAKANVPVKSDELWNSAYSHGVIARATEPLKVRVKRADLGFQQAFGHPHDQSFFNRSVRPGGLTLFGSAPSFASELPKSLATEPLPQRLLLPSHATAIATETVFNKSRI